MYKTVTPTSEMLYASIAPYDHYMLKVSGHHRIYVEQCGNPEGKPVVVVHGGPGGGCSPAMRRFFDPAVYRIILFDQRGCGRSRPIASVEENTTWDLVADMELIRQKLGIDKWIVFGGSWGATLSLIYAQAHSAHVAALVLRGVFLGTRPELEWFYGGGAGQFWPEEWARFSGSIPAEERDDLITAYNRRLFSDDYDEQVRYARLWAGWESALAVLRPETMMPTSPADYARAFARLENHYFINDIFLAPGQDILGNIDRIRHIPGRIVQGRYDMICPPASAFKLSEYWRESELVMVPTAGHALSEPEITRSLIDIMNELRELTY